MATIYEVAKAAGVSPATVSRVLNGIRVRPDLMERVTEAAERLEYSPNRMARSLRRRSSEVIALIVPDIENPYFTALARGVEDRARESGFSVILCNSDENLEKEAEYLRIAVSDQTAGVIIAHASAKTDLSPLLAEARHVVAVDRVPAAGIVDSVSVDNVAVADRATRTLLADGYRRIACITGPDDVETARDRARGWALAADPAAARGELLHADYRYEGGREAMVQVLARGEADAVVVTNNLMGAGALTALHQAGKDPRGFGIAVVGGLPFAPQWFDGVKVVPLPARELGLLAAETLINRINGHTGPPRNIVAPLSAD